MPGSHLAAPRAFVPVGRWAQASRDTWLRTRQHGLNEWPTVSSSLSGSRELGGLACEGGVTARAAGRLGLSGHREGQKQQVALDDTESRSFGSRGFCLWLRWV